jgi:hypothetical protein
MRRVLMAFLVAGSAGCFSDALTGSSAVTGKYTLSRVNGEPLPYTTSRTATTRTELLDDAVTLFGGGTYATSGHVRTTVDGQSTTAARVETGTYEVFGTSVTMRTSDGTLTRHAQLEGTRRLTFIESGLTAVYTK